MTEHLAFFGKGGVGTSTLISNIGTALVEAGFRVLLIGCSLEGDSFGILNVGIPIPTLWDQYSKYGAITFDSVVTRGFKDIYCIELGNTSVEQGASGTAQALDLLLEHDLISSLSPDFVLYDISGDQTSRVLRELSKKVGLNRIFAVTTADFNSLLFVNSSITALQYGDNTYVPVPFGGLIPNGIASSFEESIIADFARHTVTHTLGKIPRSLMVRQSELYRKTVIEASPQSNQSYFYRRLANHIVDESRSLTIKQQPDPMANEDLISWAHDWADRLYALENGLVGDGAAI